MNDNSSYRESMCQPVVTTDDLADLMRGDRPPVVLDVRWTLAGNDPAAFERGHIPGAVFVDVDRELAAPPGAGGRHPLPTSAQVDGLLRRSGIDDGTPVVVCGAADPSIAARCWWLLRHVGMTNVSVLDGGFAAWQRSGGQAETGPAGGPGGGRARAVFGGMPTVDADEAGAYGLDARSVLLDARAAVRYRGEKEPVDPVPGHIPGAVNLPLATLLRDDGRLLPAAALAAALDAVGATPGSAVAASCGSGITACMLILAGAVVGRDMALYPGSYSGWCALGRAVERSEP